MRFFCILLAAIALAGAACAEAKEPDVSARGAILIERESGRVLYERNADEKLPMASTTKVMTALLTLERCDLEEVVTASAAASGMPGTSIYLGEGEALTVEQMLLGLMLRSGNDAAVALAEHVAGDTKAFARMMNERARALGADASFVTPNGLDAPGHEASARAMALIANEAMDFPAFRRIVATREAVLPWRDSPYDRALRNKNKLLWTYEGATGVKTGFTKKAGRCLIFSAKRAGMELLGAVLNCPAWFDGARALLDWGFAEYGMRGYYYAGEEVARVPVRDGMEADTLAVSPGKFRCCLGAGEQAQLIVETESALAAPVRAGQVIGVARAVTQAGEEIGATPLVAARGVERRTFGAAFRKVARRFNPVA